MSVTCAVMTLSPARAVDAGAWGPRPVTLLSISPVLRKHQNLVAGPNSSSATDLLCGPGGSLPPRALFPHVHREGTGPGQEVQTPVSPAGVSWAVAVTGWDRGPRIAQCLNFSREAENWDFDAKSDF